MSAPGSTPIDGTGYANPEALDQVMSLDQATPGADRNLIDHMGQAHAQKDMPADETGGWNQVKGLSR